MFAIPCMNEYHLLKDQIKLAEWSVGNRMVGLDWERVKFDPSVLKHNVGMFD